MFGVLGEVLHDGKGGNGEDLLFAHEFHGLRCEIVGMVDAGDSGFRGVGRAWFAGAMHADEGASAVGLADSGGELRFVVLIGHRESVADEVVRSGLVHLGEVRALLALLAHDGNDLVRGVGVVGVRAHVLLGVVADCVLMSTQNVYGITRHAHARAGNASVVDCVAHGNVGALCAFGAHVALGGEAGHHVGFGGGGGLQRALRHGLLHCLEALVAGVEEEMHMRVDQAGHQGGVAEVDDHGSRWPRDMRSRLANALALDQHLAG